jgi:hypothetical protein
MEPMRVNRRFLYWGVVLMAIGGVLVVADLTAVDTATLTDLIRLWPIAIVAIGVSLLARRTRLALPALVAAALVPGLVVGAAFAVAPRFSGDCGAHGDVASVVTDHGAFDGPADVSVRGGCGVLHVSTATGSGWSFEASSTRATSNGPSVEATPTSLFVRASGNGFNLLDEGRAEWDLVLPTSEINSLKLVVTTGDGHIDLSGARIGDLRLTANAGRAVVDASDAASLHSVSGVVNVGAMSLELPASSDFSGAFTVGAGKLDVCTAPGLGLRVSARSTGGNIEVEGLSIDNAEWQSSNYETAPHRADLNVRVTFGAIDINPIGGCK